MYLVAFRVVLKILVLLQPLFPALFLLFNIISEIIIDYNSRAANPGGWGDTSPQYLTSIPPIIEF